FLAAATIAGGGLLVATDGGNSAPQATGPHNNSKLRYRRRPIRSIPSGSCQILAAVKDMPSHGGWHGLPPKKSGTSPLLALIPLAPYPPGSHRHFLAKARPPPGGSVMTLSPDLWTISGPSLNIEKLAMTDSIPLDHEEIIRRIGRDLADSYDEEL